MYTHTQTQAHTYTHTHTHISFFFSGRQRKSCGCSSNLVKVVTNCRLGNLAHCPRLDSSSHTNARTFKKKNNNNKKTKAKVNATQKNRLLFSLHSLFFSLCALSRNGLFQKNRSRHHKTQQAQLTLASKNNNQQQQPPLPSFLHCHPNPHSLLF